MHIMPLENATGACDLAQRSEATQEIIGHRPGFIERWALLLFLAVLLSMAGGTWFIRYPDIIETGGTLVAANGPKEILAWETGRLVRLLVRNGQPVHKGDMIGWIESTASTEDVLQLSALLDSSIRLIGSGHEDKVSGLLAGDIRNIGSLQPSYQTFIAALQQFDDYMVNGFYIKRKSLLLRDISSIGEMNRSLNEQKQLTEQDTDLSRQSFTMNEQLYKEKVISAEEFRTERSKLINKQMAIPQINSGILSNLNQQRDKVKELQQLEHDVAQQKAIFEEALQTLRSNVDEWLRQYIIRAPLDGMVFFTVPLQENQFIEEGKVLGYVSPPGSRYYARVYLPQNNLGKITTGLEVQLRFAAYPYQETGCLCGRLDYISSVASDSGFMATVRLDDGLRTNLHKVIQFKSGLRADALIITKNNNLLQRLYNNLVHSTSMGK